MKVLLFGGTGFLGKNLTEQLLAAGHEVGLYVRETALATPFIASVRGDVQLRVGDFQYEQDFDRLVHGYDAVYHLIAASVPGKVQPEQDIDAVVKPTLRLQAACVREQVGRVIFFSSGGTVYGIPQVVPIPEDASGDPISTYGIHKLTIEYYLYFYQYMYHLPSIVLRIANPYGRYQRPFTNQGLIPNVLARCLTGQPVEVWGDGEAVRDYIYVDDVIRAALLALTYRGAERVFNIGSGEGHSINEVLHTVDRLLPGRLQVQRRPGRPVDVPTNVLDITRARQALHWQPDTALEQGIQQMIDLWQPGARQFL